MTTLGILGGGQLGRMTAHAAQQLGVDVCVWAQHPDEPAAQVCPRCILAPWDDASAFDAFVHQVDVITLEFENVSLPLVERLHGVTPVRPGPTALRVASRRDLEKDTATRAGVPTAPWAAVRMHEDLDAARSSVPFPAVLKTLSEGYDGKGQRRVDAPDQLHQAWAELQHRPCLLEAWVPFEAEGSILLARTLDGEVCAWPMAHNVHRHHILHTTTVPAPFAPVVQQACLDHASRLATALDVVGLLAVEFFLLPDGSSLFNECAPRPHNSGHWTMDGSSTSQFAQLVRAVLGMPLGPTDLRAPTRMTNLIGDDIDQRDAWLARGAHVHLYGKREARPGRKMGHVNETGLR
jgi:5-(carboxyamino)imidazole ribonucleotide synthase